jgi:hypothetical protein
VPDAEVTDERIYADLKAYADAGMLEYVLPTDPIGEQWIVGWKGRILKFVTKEGIVGFLTGIQAAVLFAAALAPKHRPDEICTCHPGDLMGEGICEYRMLADAVGGAFNPPDDDAAEVSVLITATERAAEHIRSDRCCCLAGYPDAPCPRCSALGQWRREPVQR